MKNYTDLTLLIDRSGSMSSISSEMEEGFKHSFLIPEQKSGDTTVVSTIYFDHEYSKGIEAVPISQVEGIKIEPRGSTALLDSFKRAIDETGARLAALPEEDRPNRVLFYVITDGAENCSRKTSKEELKQAVVHQQEVYAWDFVFLGANMDSFAAGGAIGIAQASTANFEATRAGVAKLWENNSETYALYKSIDRSVDRKTRYCATIPTVVTTSASNTSNTAKQDDTLTSL